MWRSPTACTARGCGWPEWASVLDVELPAADATGRYPRAWLAAACIKGGREGRTYRIPRAVVDAIASYCGDHLPVGAGAGEGVWSRIRALYGSRKPVETSPRPSRSRSEPGKP